MKGNCSYQCSYQSERTIKPTFPHLLAQQLFGCNFSLQIPENEFFCLYLFLHPTSGANFPSKVERNVIDDQMNLPDSGLLSAWVGLKFN